jgi:hypothetical protein
MEVIRIYRGPFEGHDISRLQVWYRKRGESEYRPGRTVAFNSELIPGVIEGLVLMAGQEPKVRLPERSDSTDLTQTLRAILEAHRRPLHWEVLAEIVHQEYPRIGASKWAIYNALLAAPNLFQEDQEDVFSAGS